MRKNFMNNSTGYFEMLGQRESSGNYHARNSQGYLGKYQMGEYAMIDTGYYKKNNHIGSNDWSGQFTGKDGVYSARDFLNNPKAQENAVRAYSQKVWGYIKNYATKYDGQILNGIPITQSGMLAGAHLVGHKELRKYLESGGTYVPTDYNNVPITEYMQKFANYPVFDITKTLPKENKYELYKRIINPIHNVMPTGFASSIGGSFVDEVIKNLPQNNPEQNSASKEEIKKFINPVTGDSKIFTREKLGKMSTEEFSKNEQAIYAQLNTLGIPSQGEVNRAVYNSSSEDADGHWVTINGHHVLIKD